MAVAMEGSLYARLLQDLENSAKIKQEVVSGRRIGFYRLKSQLGTGNFAQVKLGLHLLTNEKVAVKIIDKTRLDDTTSRLLSREISCMERLCHNNLVKLFEVHETFSRLSLVMECASEGDLQSRVEDNGPFPEVEAKNIFAQLAAGINHMHSNGVTHRDLKPENVLYVSSTRIKIGDFGFSTPVTTDPLSTFCGSPAFAAPELLQEQSYMGPAVDMWALGVTLYYMVTGNVPFAGNSVLQIKENILKGSYNAPTRVGTQCQELIAKLLNLEPSERPKISTVQTDKWLDGIIEDNESSVHKDMVDNEIIDQMKELGVQVDDDTTSSLLNEPRTVISGTYRILLHQKMEGHLCCETSTPPQITTTINDGSRQKKTRVCTIL